MTGDNGDDGSAADGGDAAADGAGCCCCDCSPSTLVKIITVASKKTAKRNIAVEQHEHMKAQDVPTTVDN